MTRRNPLSAWKALLAIVALALSGIAAHAQEPPQGADDPPVRVGRMSYVNGDVSFSPAGNEEWVHARVNRPIVTGDQLWSDNNGRAEVTIDNSTVAFKNGSTVYVNHLIGECSGLKSGWYTLVTRSSGPGMCRGDIADVADVRTGMVVGSCAIGDFTPYTRT